MNDHSRDLFEDDSDCSSLNPVETSTPVRSVPPTMPGLATAISPTRPGFKRSKKHHLKEKRRQYRIKNMLSKKHQLSEASSHQVVAVSCKKEDDGSLGFGFSIEGVLNKVIRLYRNTQYDKNCQYIMQGDILLQIGKESFLTPGGANVYMKRCKVGQILTFFEELCRDIERLKISKDDEVSSIQSKLDETVAGGVIVKQQLMSEIDTVNQELKDCHERLDKESLILQQEIAKGDKLINIKVDYEKTIEACQSSIAELAERKVQLENQLSVIREECKQREQSEEQLSLKVESLEIAHSKLSSSYESLRSDQLSTSELLKQSQVQVEEGQSTIQCQRDQIMKLEVQLDQADKDGVSCKASMEQSIELLRQEQEGENEIHKKRISELEMLINTTNIKISELTEKYTSTLESHQQEISTLNETMRSQSSEHEAEIKFKTEAFTRVQDELQRLLEETEKNLEQEVQKIEELNRDLEITKQSLDQSLKDQNEVVSQLTDKTQELQVVSNKLLVKDCEFNKLLGAVQNLKSRCAAVATPMTPASTPQHAAIRPTNHSTPMSAPPMRTPSTPKSATPLKPLLREAPGMTTPQMSSTKAYNSTPRSSGTRKSPHTFNTPRTPNYSQNSENPKGILRSEGSASKPNRVVFSTPIEQKGAVPSDSDTSVLDIETVNKSFKSSTPQSVGSGRSYLTPVSYARSKLHSSTPSAVTPSAVTPRAVTPIRSHPMDNSIISPAMSSQSAADRLPRSKMIKPPKKRLRPAMGVTKREDENMLAKTMKKHRAVVGYSRPMNAARPMRESDSDCFGFGSD